jgi:hypothetical protein
MLLELITRDAGYPASLSAMSPFPIDVQSERQIARKVLRFPSSCGAVTVRLANFHHITFKPHLRR